MDKGSITLKDTSWIPKVRNGLAVVVVASVSLLGGYALLFVRPGWEWTQEQNEEQLTKEANDLS